jgi:hypothetical protein
MSKKEIDELCAKVWVAAFCSCASKYGAINAKGFADKAVDDFIKQFNLS